MAKLSNQSGQAGDADDLIAELARVMAQDAAGDSASDTPSQGRDEPAAERPAAAPPPATQSRAEPAREAWSESRPSAPSRPAPVTVPTARSAGPAPAEPLSIDPADRPSGAGARFEPARQAETPRHQDRREPEPFNFDFGFDKPSPPAADRDPGPAAPPPVVARDRAEPPADPEPAAASRPEPSPPADRPEEAPVVDPIAALIAGRLSAELDLDTAPKAGSGPDADARRDDGFDVAPVFGLGGAVPPSRGETRAERDPLDDIESLIGKAIRVDYTDGHGDEDQATAPADEADEQDPPPAPVLRRARRHDSDVDQAAMAAEEAILAAAAATGATIDRLDTRRGMPAEQNFGADAPPPPPPGIGMAPDMADDGEFDLDEDARPRRARGALASYGIPVAAGALILAIGAGAYWMFGMGGTSGPAPLLTASEEPVRQEPDAAVNTEATTRSVVFDGLTGETASADDEQLVSRDQTDGASAADVARVIASEADEDGLASRRVRTVTVRPDGTIVSGDDATAGNEILPVERPDVPELPGETIDIAALTASLTGMDEPAAPAADVFEENPLAGTTVTAADGSLIPLPAPRPPFRATAPVQETAALAAAEPAGQPAAAATASDLLAAEMVEVPADVPGDELVAAMPETAAPVDLIETPAAAPAAPAATTTAATTPAPVTGSSAPAYVQLSSQRSEATAQQSINEIRARFGGVLGGGNTLEIQRADLGADGVYYRVRYPADSMATANSVCSSIRSAGGDCFVRTD